MRELLISQPHYSLQWGYSLIHLLDVLRTCHALEPSVGGYGLMPEGPAGLFFKEKATMQNRPAFI